ncbi:MAG: glycosyltransferase family 4 protein [Symploca sp. SIO2C1]|nr:glycosyltransferase family 4 protein [Symploca sp. SIO2C1]
MSNQSTVLILINWLQGNKEWSVRKVFENRFHKVDLLGVNMPTSASNRLQTILNEWPSYLKLAWLGFFQGKKYDVFIDYTCIAGLFLGIFYSLVPFINRPKIILLKFVYIERDNKLYGKLRYLFFRWGLTSVDLAICSSLAEAQRHPKYFNSDPKKFVFIPFGIDSSMVEQFRVTADAQGKYIFAAGFSNRDYPTFINAVSSVDMPVVVVAKKYNLDGCQIPPHVQVFYDISRQEYYDKLQNAAFVVIPINDPTVSAGQLLALEAMYFGKPVIATKTQGLIDYIEDGYSGLLVTPSNVESMRKAILELKNNPRRARNISATGQAVVKNKFNVENFANSLADYAIDVIDQN